MKLTAGPRCRGRSENDGSGVAVTNDSVDACSAVGSLAIFSCAAGDGPHGQRLRGMIVVLWRAGLRIQKNDPGAFAQKLRGVLE